MLDYLSQKNWTAKSAINPDRQLKLFCQMIDSWCFSYCGEQSVLMAAMEDPMFRVSFHSWLKEMICGEDNAARARHTAWDIMGDERSTMNRNQSQIPELTAIIMSDQIVGYIMKHNYCDAAPGGLWRAISDPLTGVKFHVWLDKMHRRQEEIKSWNQLFYKRIMIGGMTLEELEAALREYNVDVSKDDEGMMNSEAFKAQLLDYCEAEPMDIGFAYYDDLGFDQGSLNRTQQAYGRIRELGHGKLPLIAAPWILLESRRDARFAGIVHMEPIWLRSFFSEHKIFLIEKNGEKAKLESCNWQIESWGKRYGEGFFFRLNQAGGGQND